MAIQTTLLILGASGDLTKRLLLPGLATLLDVKQDWDIELIGAGVDELSDEDWKQRVRESFSSAECSGDRFEQIIAASHYRKTDVTSADDLGELLAQCSHAPAIYFALPPAITEQACEQLKGMDLPDGVRLAMEKPFGTDAASAEKLNELLHSFIPEERIHRVDHFLGRSTVLNLLGLRFSNRIIEPLLSSTHVESVDIIYDETLGLENRARYYDHAGALTDMIQSHLLQVLAVVAMEAPATLDADDLRTQKQLVFRAVKPWGDDPATAGKRARYTAGTVGDRQLPSYVDEDGVDPANQTETLAQMTVEVANWRWAGVPFTLRSGKALGEPRREIVINFRPSPHVPDGVGGEHEQDRLRIWIAPDEMSLELNVNGPGDPYVVDRAKLETKFNPGRLTAYGEVLAGVLEGDATLSVRGDSAVQCWRIVQPVIDAWRNGESPIDEYPAGSHGPSNWDNLLH
ncbi:MULTISPECIES: glucose-6-phosphate dehydrogenase [unclassified Curtobacterium]|uniref:glucose-6-phosphate dehydrogenase n=1 Tax=unclassified Curtobacterium TaxID=257496 RepID=UPI000DA9CDC7|nr:MULTISPECIES: glucose-6-phosphate dehydrogenase [unclassified Curtobacterium]PZE78447.1 glucose-6-phosphate dehydrogenase [Curtobacterium sp. MCBD17_019]WIB68128.1 glucose-6-phosphate dehydrogenase [Curtobacterium sp. MCBD17_035]WIE55290.1 glucose-6-phosphate dehydrogenase [Curtobacterium sp. MCBD17_003]